MRPKPGTPALAPAPPWHPGLGRLEDFYQLNASIPDTDAYTRTKGCFQVHTTRSSCRVVFDRLLTARTGALTVGARHARDRADQRVARMAGSHMGGCKGSIGTILLRNTWVAVCCQKQPLAVFRILRAGFPVLSRHHPSSRRTLPRTAPEKVLTQVPHLSEKANPVTVAS